jgi:hypothetical protein
MIEWIVFALMLSAFFVGFYMGHREARDDAVIRGFARYHPMTKGFEWLKSDMVYRKAGQPLEYERP